MYNEKIVNKIKEIICNEIHTSSNYINERTIFDNIPMDGFNMLETFIQLEFEYNINILDTNLEDVITIGDIAKYIESQI